MVDIDCAKNSEMAASWWGLSLAIAVLSWTIGTESPTAFLYEDPDNPGRPIDDPGRIKNMTDQRRERFSPRFDCDLRVYDADKEADVIREWHDLVKDPIDEETAMRQLLQEACDDDNKDLSKMCLTFVIAKHSKKCVPGLTMAECVAVTMYTYEGNGFYREFNNASAYGVWEPYKIYTSLLFSAVKKLSVIEPIPFNSTLYRGMGVSCNRPNAKRIFWKTFTSTSFDRDIARYFGESTFYEFLPTATLFGARVKNLSFIGEEEEVLIPPFEVFNFVKADGQKFYFSSSRTQDLLHGQADKCHSAKTLTTLTAVLSTAIALGLLRL